MFAGDLDRARRQIDALEYTDNDLIRAAMSYRMLIDSEQARRDVFARGVPPAAFCPQRIPERHAIDARYSASLS